MEDFEDRKVDVIRSRTAQVPHKPGYIAEREIPGLAEYRRVEILVDALVDAPPILGFLPLVFGRCPTEKMLAKFPPFPIARGRPVWKEAMPLICHPPTTQSAAAGIDERNR